MSFHHLPDDLRDRPLTDPRTAADVVDLLVGDDDRHHGCVGLMLCDEAGRLLQPVVVGDVPENASTDGLVSVLGLFLPSLAEGGGSVLVVRGRRRGTLPNDLDREWHQVALDCCAATGVRLIGFQLATRDGVFELPPALRAAS